LIVEPDPLTQWSLKTYLQQWFSVESTDSASGAERILEAHRPDALIVSDDLSPTALAALEERVRGLNPRVAIVRTVTDPSRPLRPGEHAGCLEKPFELAQLARLLGIREGELPPER
jgi:DNA-binding response OmpR family regulator